jgi:hypothetical protein
MPVYNFDLIVWGILTVTHETLGWNWATDIICFSSDREFAANGSRQQVYQPKFGRIC